ncbi:radical SAM protein [Natranaerofaba carboxydovora]|uniref:radical SAM protein n=1 Tax=Natranaerofaba carboxydovora TaxID=2742683 RepID=UPI001F135A05|nr:radical SAM protein [Natranaerofaba carboxydovora]UMZ72613.1 Putative mycofactocin radical SAM maturase MftC [Natranaerofaba carboxydovora]
MAIMIEGSVRERAKQFMGDRIFKKALNYMEKAPYNNLIKTMEMIQKAPIASHHHKMIQDAKYQLQTDQVKQEYLKRIFGNVSINVQQKGLVNLFLNAMLMGVPKQNKMAEELGVSVPFSILIDPTSKCNLNCFGCWAGAYEKHNSLKFEEVDRIIEEAKELGIYFIALSGGEPFMWPRLFELFRKHDDMAFMVYSNGTLINEQIAEKLEEIGNVSVVLSLEGKEKTTDDRRGQGVFNKVMKAMDNLRKVGVPFGFSVTLTSENCEEVMSDEFIDLMIQKGALYGWSFHYIPVGSDPDYSLMLTASQRSWLIERVRQIRTEKTLQMADFWNDGSLPQGCIAGGRRYFHITAKGDVEPCAFIHFAADNIKRKSLKKILNTPIFKAYQKRQPFSDNMLRPCPLIDVPEALREIIQESGAKPTHPGAEKVLEGLEAHKMDEIANNWKEKAEDKYEEIKKA